jgi:hypothetical protein
MTREEFGPQFTRLCAGHRFEVTRGQRGKGGVVMERRTGFVKQWLDVQSAASSVEWPRARMVEAIAFGEVPAIQLDGEVRVWASALGTVNRRTSEHD